MKKHNQNTAPQRDAETDRSPKDTKPGEASEVAPDPQAVEGGRRSSIDGKFEADHRPSR